MKLIWLAASIAVTTSAFAQSTLVSRSENDSEETEALFRSEDEALIASEVDAFKTDAMAKGFEILSHTSNIADIEIPAQTFETIPAHESTVPFCKRMGKDLKIQFFKPMSHAARANKKFRTNKPCPTDKKFLQIYFVEKCKKMGERVTEVAERRQLVDYVIPKSFFQHLVVMKKFPKPEPQSEPSCAPSELPPPLAIPEETKKIVEQVKPKPSPRPIPIPEALKPYAEEEGFREALAKAQKFGGWLCAFAEVNDYGNRWRMGLPSGKASQEAAKVACQEMLRKLTDDAFWLKFYPNRKTITQFLDTVVPKCDFQNEDGKVVPCTIRRVYSSVRFQSIGVVPTGDPIAAYAHRCTFLGTKKAIWVSAKSSAIASLYCAEKGVILFPGKALQSTTPASKLPGFVKPASK